MTEGKLQVGAGKALIPFREEDFPLKSFTGMHDEIGVRALLLGMEDIRFMILSVELTSLPPEAIGCFQRACREEAGVEETRVFVSVTHTFSAPHIPPHIKNEAERKLSDTMYERLLPAIRSAAKQAADTLDEAGAEYCESACCMNVNRNVFTDEGWWLGRNEDEFSDHTVRVLKLSRAGRIFAYLFNYDIQPSVMDRSEALSGGRLISGDLAGAAMKELEADGVTAVFLPGCAADQSPIVQAVLTNASGETNDLYENGFVLVKRLGEYLAERVRCAKPTGQSVSGDVCLLNVAAQLPEQQMKYSTKELRPHRSYSFELTGRDISVPVALIGLGDVRFLFTAPELNSGFGMKIREILGESVIIGTLVNGAVKYLPEAEDFARITYEAMNTALGPDSAEKFLAAVRKLHTEEKKL